MQKQAIKDSRNSGVFRVGVVLFYQITQDSKTVITGGLRLTIRKAALFLAVYPVVFQLYFLCLSRVWIFTLPSVPTSKTMKIKAFLSLTWT